MGGGECNSPLRRRWAYAGIMGLALCMAYYFCLPDPLFQEPYSTVLTAADGSLLGARIAEDGQWRFPPVQQVPEQYAVALLAFEDKRFYSHFGIDIRAIGRALLQNIEAGKVVSGGSTISMQLMRIARKGKQRTIFQKFIEAVQATRLEFTFSKKEILAIYASHAPFGGNVVGIQSAAWRYFGKQPEQLSWAEATTLAVLPNAPALIHPGRNRNKLLAKRNRLLDRLYAFGKMDSLACQLAKTERIPDKPQAMPQLAPHLLDFVSSRRAPLTHKGESQPAPSTPKGESSPRSKNKTIFHTSIQKDLQEQCTQIVNYHQQNLSGNGIHNVAALVLDVKSNKVLSYVGNAPSAGKMHGKDVDIIQAPRSTGSILKPFLYAMMLNEGVLLPEQLVSDIPTILPDGYQPENYHETFDGAVSAKKALVRSLNIPFVLMLKDYGLEKCQRNLFKYGHHYINKPADHYGLSLILGGAESSLWDISNAFAGMSRTLGNYDGYGSRYCRDDFEQYALLTPQPPKGVAASRKSLFHNKQNTNLQEEAPYLGAGAIYQCFEAMREVERPTVSGEWEAFSSGRKIAWKTGTSFGFRDAWAVGVTPEYVVGVWVGNADGEGRPGLIGVHAAGPILFELFKLLPPSSWFEPPYNDLVQLPLCRQSGFRAGQYCEVDTIWVPTAGEHGAVCPYHELIHLDQTEQWQVHATCVPTDAMVHKNWFVLPPLQEHYYKFRHPEYSVLPPWHVDCKTGLAQGERMQFIYPKHSGKIYVPIDLDGHMGRTVFEVAHRNPAEKIHWHLDDVYLTTTSVFHSVELNPSEGMHQLTVVDQEGGRLERWFEVVGRDP